jgi:hypothetical protein
VPAFRPVLRAALLALFATVSFTAAAQQAGPRFVPSADGQEVLDTQTSLVWRRCVEGMKWDGKTCTGKPLKLKFGLAKQHASKEKATTAAWRIPTREELGTLVVKQKAKPLVDGEAFPNQPKVLYWARRKGFDDNLNAWTLDFGNGKAYGDGGNKHGVRLVREK